MNKTTKIIIALGVALLIVATVLVVSLVQNSNFGKETTTKPGYSLQATKAPSTTGETESWVDLEQMASELGISEAYYSLIENGERQQNMDISLAIKIGNILGMNLQEIASAEEKGA